MEDRHPKTGASYGQKTPLDYAKQENRFEVVRFFQHLDEIERMKQRRAAKIIGKENKHVKTFTTKANGNDKEYDIDSVLQSLGIDDKKDQPKKKKPKKKVKKPQNEKVSKTEQLEKLESCGAEALPVELRPKNAQFVLNHVIKPTFSIHVDMPLFARIVLCTCLKSLVKGVRIVEQLSKTHLECFNKTIFEL